MQNQGKEELLDLWDVPWPVMKVLIGGESSIDMPTLSVRDWDDATKFVRSYGYDPDREDDARFIHGVIIEALAFIEKHLMPDEWRRGKHPTDEILLCDDVRTLLLMASDRTKANAHKRSWSCAILRVMHTIAHIEGVQTVADLEAARVQIQSRFESYVTTDADGTSYLGQGDFRVPLVKVEWKSGKTRDSIILKLLHKRANVAETIYDLIGVRIVTSKLSDVILAVRIMQYFYMVTFPNCNPSRARNTLLDLELFQKEAEELKGKLESGELSAREFQAQVSAIVAPIDNSQRTNPHSASAYQAIQFTCRQLIRWPNPVLEWMGRIDQLSRDAKDREQRESWRRFLTLVKGGMGVRQNMELSAFFPFEVQIMDSTSYSKNQFGEASHDRYKRSQCRAARRRVLAGVLEVL